MIKILGICMILVLLMVAPSAGAAETVTVRDAAYWKVLGRYLHAGNQIHAVDIEGKRHLIWGNRMTTGVAQAYRDLLLRLETAVILVRQLPNDSEDELLRQNLQDQVRLLREIYSGIETKSDDEIVREYRPFQRVKEYRRHCNRLFEELLDGRPPPDREMELSEQLHVFPNNEDRAAYRLAVELFQQSRLREAFDQFVAVQQRYPHGPAADILNVGIADCLMRDFELWTGRTDPEEEALRLLETVIDGEEYSPVLFASFYRWRTVYQSYWHGMSNYSEIPNWDYNLRRHRLSQRIIEYLAENPRDFWARVQLIQLMGLGNITRGCMAGNCNLIDWGYLYMDEVYP